MSDTINITPPRDRFSLMDRVPHDGHALRRTRESRHTGSNCVRCENCSQSPISRSNIIRVMQIVRLHVIYAWLLSAVLIHLSKSSRSAHDDDDVSSTVSTVVQSIILFPTQTALYACSNNVRKENSLNSLYFIVILFCSPPPPDHPDVCE